MRCAQTNAKLYFFAVSIAIGLDIIIEIIRKTSTMVVAFAMMKFEGA